jgi:hypothetical protein
MEKFIPDRKEEEQAVKRGKDEKKRQFVLLSKTPKRPPETVSAKSTPKTINVCNFIMFNLFGRLMLLSDRFSRIDCKPASQVWHS